MKLQTGIETKKTNYLWAIYLRSSSVPNPLTAMSSRWLQLRSMKSLQQQKKNEKVNLLSYQLAFETKLSPTNYLFISTWPHIPFETTVCSLCISMVKCNQTCGGCHWDALPNTHKQYTKHSQSPFKCFLLQRIISIWNQEEGSLTWLIAPIESK